MCRLFFSLNFNRSNVPKKMLLDFFEKCEKEDIKDGFGISWYHDNTWHTYKKPLHYLTDPHIFKKVDHLSGKVILAHARNINKKDVSKYHVTKEKCIQNTHPILYKDNIFMHHGDLLLETSEGLKGYQRYKRLPEFKLKIKELISNIDESILKNMKGNTDSELILFLFLSIIKKKELENPNVNKDDLIVSSFLQLIALIKNTKLVNRSNIMFANNDYILVAKIIKNDTKFIANSLDLFIDTSTNNGIVISSIRLSPESKNMKSNTAIIINHKKNIIKTFSI